MLNKTHQKVVNTSNDMFDENYYRLTILGKGFIGPLKIPGIFFHNRCKISCKIFCLKFSFLWNLIEYIIKLIYQSSNVWYEQMYHCIIFDLEWFLIRDYYITGTRYHDGAT